MEKKQLQGVSWMPEDFKDFIQCLNSNKVKYLLTGRQSDLGDAEKLEHSFKREHVKKTV